jgi:glutamate N-acetyltransferase / amino-acid N-acetyltransferase
MNKTDGGILAAKGFKGGAAAAGVKAAGGLDVALIWSETRAKTAAVFTNNSVTAAPVQISKLHCRDHDVRAIVANSGNANCMTGVKGRLDAERMAQGVADPLNMDKDEVLVASTGIIGRELPMDKIDAGIRAAYDARGSTTAGDVAKAIMTTDTHPKSAAYTREIGGKKVTLGGCAKGSGMIQPDMATMLCFITTDAAIAPKLLDKALREAVRTTFNAITVDGCMSTNDTVAVMANGQAGNRAIGMESDDYRAFCELLRRVCLDLALMVVRDGEGATMLVTIDVKGAKDYDQAKTIGYAIANSPLVKTATRAKTENWGRIAQAVGALGLDIDENSLEIKVDKNGEDELKITVKVELGKAEATVYTCDLTKEYVDINVEYN